MHCQRYCLPHEVLLLTCALPNVVCVPAMSPDVLRGSWHLATSSSATTLESVPACICICPRVEAALASTLDYAPWVGEVSSSSWAEQGMQTRDVTIAIASAVLARMAVLSSRASAWEAAAGICRKSPFLRAVEMCESAWRSMVLTCSLSSER